MTAQREVCRFLGVMVGGAAQGPVESPSKVGLQEETSVLTRQVSPPELSGSFVKDIPAF